MARQPSTAWIVVVVVCCLGVAWQSAEGREKQPLRVADFLDWEGVANAQISPDGSQVVYTRRWVNRIKDRWESDLWLIGSDGSKNRRLTEGSGALWSPDGSRLAFVREAEPEGAQIFVRWMDDEGAVSQVTRLDQSPENLRWSPDGESIAFTMLVEEKPSWKIEMPSPPKGAKWTEEPRIVESTHYRQDRRGFMKNGWVHLFVVTADGGTPRQLTDGAWHVGARPVGLDYGVGIDWTPDGSEIVFDALRDEDADRRYRESHLYAVDVASGEIRQVTEQRGPWGGPVVSPDGRSIAFAGFAWTPQTYKAAELHVIGIDGKNQRKVSGDFDRAPGDMYWSADGSGIYFGAGDRGSRNVYFASRDGGVRPATRGIHMLGVHSMSDDGVVAGVRTSFQSPPDVVVFPIEAPDALKQLTAVNDDVLADRRLGEVEEIWYESSDGTRVQGWIVKPPDFDAAEKYPLILHIHGGPHGMYDVGFDFSFQHLAAEGYVVLYTNPRGSTGYGTDFGNAIDNAYPSVDYEDLMAGVDALLERGYVDRKRMYVTGVSGGGVLSSWIIGHTDRFAAAAVRAPVINWISFAGTTDITAWGFYRFRPPFWEEPQRWLKHSPLMYVQNVKTPTLLMTGELDLRTPMGQSEEYYQALRQLGVPTALIRFHDEYHGTGSKPSNFMRTQLYLLKWFGEHTLDAASTASQPAAD